jgi:UPF0716 protein FxsA
MNSFFLFFIGITALEIFLCIKIGSEIGALTTIGLIFMTAIIGVYFVKLQGIQTLRSGMTNLYQNKLPIYEIISGASLAIAALLLILPGFFTDMMGFFLVIPFTRKLFLKIFLKKNNISKREKKDDKVLDGEIIEDKKDEL